jgi:spermidine synthase
MDVPLVVRRRAGRVDLVLGSVVLLSSAALETERAFGALVPASARRVLVGGLGFGATVKGVLDAAPEARVIVSEKVSALPALLRGELADVAVPGILDDPRVTIAHADVADVIARERSLDAILLDVDNGPEWASFRTNAKLYSPAGLAAAKAALAPGGTYAVWSGYPADAFLGKLRAAGFVPRLVPLREGPAVRARAYVGVI